MADAFGELDFAYLHVDFLYSLFREWTEDGQLWVQYVSSTPATRLDVINLQVC